jgi:hypothetical protein
MKRKRVTSGAAIFVYGWLNSRYRAPDLSTGFRDILQTTVS